MSPQKKIIVDLQIHFERLETSNDRKSKEGSEEGEEKLLNNKQNITANTNQTDSINITYNCNNHTNMNTNQTVSTVKKLTKQSPNSQIKTYIYRTKSNFAFAINFHSLNAKKNCILGNKLRMMKGCNDQQGQNL